ncbi:MAG: hypothetical protein ACKVQJ_02640 [Pyrinomonadaceae bacterium]
MKSISHNLSFLAVAPLAFIIGATAANSFGQDGTKIKNKDKSNREFCSQNNWSDDSRVSFNELRETTAPASSDVNIDGRQNGGIKVIGEDRSDVLVRACVQAWGKSDEEAKNLAAGVKISTGGTIKAEYSAGDNNWSVSYEVHVPRVTNLNLTAHNGGIIVTSVDGTVNFQTQNGGIILSDPAGDYKGKTQNGGVFVTLSGNTWKGTGLDVTTTNGGVVINMPETYAAHVETGTVNGGYISNIPALRIDTENIVGAEGRSRSKRIVTNINGGGAPIKVITTNGGVRIGTDNDKD